MHYDTHSNLMKMALRYGCKTVSDLAKFLREHNLDRLMTEQSDHALKISCLKIANNQN